MSQVQLYCLPYAGGSARIFEPWRSELPDWITVEPVELPGRGTRLREPPVADPLRLARQLTGTLAARLAASGAPRFAVLGYSYGAFLAFEIARRLEYLEGRRAEHVLVAAARAPRWPAPGPSAARQSDHELRTRLAALGGTEPELLANDEFMRLMLPVLRADLTGADSYLLAPGPLLSSPLTAFGGEQDRTVSARALLAWRECTTGPFVSHQLPGGHFFLRSAESRLLGLIGRTLRGTVPRAAGAPERITGSPDF